ncbi:uncharacterized protein [Choristoneura fumiferana]|uniref:uncharacterized protein n=1 Tax=Choristoneura fumiferana TaxID=7141 RepID=UPI003D15BAD5
MFFVFHILVFAYLTRTEINCYSQGTTTEGKNYVRKQEAIFNFKAAAHYNGTTQNPNKLNTDLKSNVFNKILFDEMLSVKNNHDTKDSTDDSLVKISPKIYLVTPTFGMKQKWPFEHVNSNKNKLTETSLPEKDDNLKTLMHIIMKNSDGTSKLNKVYKTIFEKSTLVNRNLVSNKVVGTRSLPDSPLQVVLKDRPAPGVRICTCMKTNPSTKCSHSCTGSSTTSNKKRCTHSTPSARSHDCSRYSTNHSCTNTPPTQVSTPNPYSFYPAFYLPYTYFGNDITYRVTYPQPNIFDDVKYRKPKHRKTTTTRYDDDLYYDDSDNREKNNYNDNRAEDDDETKLASEKLENYHTTKKGSTLFINIDYIEEVDSRNDEKDVEKLVMTNKGVKYDVNQDRLIKELINDLKGKRKKVIVKDCYCSSSIKTFQINIALHLFTLLCYCMKS